MTYCNSIVSFFSSFSRGDIIAILAIPIGMAFIVLWDRRKKRQDIIDAFTAPLLRLKTVIETKSIPSRDAYDEFISQFATHENAMSVIRNRMNDVTKSTFDNKWIEYKNERDQYKNYWDTNLKGKFSIHSHSEQLIVLINELIDNANKI